MSKYILSAFADEAASSLDGQIAALKRNGISQLEIRNINGKPVIDLSDNELMKIADSLSKNGISVSSIGSPIGKISINDEFAPHFGRFRRTVTAAKILNTQRIRMFSFFIPENENPADYRPKVMERLESLCDYAIQNEVYCYHENEKGIYGDKKSRVLDIFDSLGGKIKGIFDPANYIQCGELPNEIFADLSAHSQYLHIKDALLEDFSVVPAGKGDGHIKEIIKAFAGENGVKLLTIEPHLHVFDGLNSLQNEEIKHRYSYKTTDEAFDAACDAVKQILSEVE